MNETNEQPETTSPNACRMIGPTSQGDQLRAMADLLTFMHRPPGNYCELADRLRGMAHWCDHTAMSADDAARLLQRNLELEKSLHELRSLENRDIEKLRIVAKKVEVTSTGYWRQVMHDVLNKLTVTLEDGTLAYDETNQLARHKSADPEQTP